MGFRILTLLPVLAKNRPALLFISLVLVNTLISQAQNNQSSLRGDGMGFIENKGQIVDMNNQLRPDILYMGDGGGAKIYLRKGGISYVVSTYEKLDEWNQSWDQLSKPASYEEYTGENLLNPYDKNDPIVKLHRIDVDFKNSNINSTMLHEQQTEGYFNYYLGHCKTGITNVHSYNRVTYQNMYNNIDVIYYGNKKNGLKYDIIVKPGGNPSEIKMLYSGVETLNIADEKLQVTTPLGNIMEWMPKVYQHINGKIIDVNCEYILSDKAVSFNLGSYNKNYPLVIDPWISYFGGADIDYTSGIAVDDNGNSLIGGYTRSLNFPLTAGAFQTLLNFGTPNPTSTVDCFAAKLDINGNLLWCTLYGGSGQDNCSEVAFDKNGDVILTGTTLSDDFPVDANPFQGFLAGTGNPRVDAFIVKLDGNGNRLWGTYYGGGNFDWARHVKTDKNNNVLITGSTNSLDLPVTPGAFQTISMDPTSGKQEIFILKFDANGNRLWATYYGGSHSDYGYAIAIDSNDDMVITGYTLSTDFPVSAGVFQTSLNGSGDGFIIKFDSNGNRLWATLFGGEVFDQGSDIDVDSDDNIILTGTTAATSFPVTAGCNQPSIGGSIDIYIAKFNSAGNQLWATYQGSQYHEAYPYCAIDMSDNIYIIAEVEDVSTAVYSTYTCALQKNFGGGLEDQYLTKYDKDGRFICNTYLGGNQEDEMDYGAGIVCYRENVYYTLITKGPGYPITTNAFQQNFGGGTWDIIIGQICGYNCGATDIQTEFSFTEEITGCNVLTKMDVETDACETDATNWQWTFEGGTPSFAIGQAPEEINYSENGTYTISLVINTPCSSETISKTIEINIPGIELCCDYYIPNAFSPNNDGNNDVFKVLTKCSKKSFDLFIFNRWGEKVFHTNDHTIGWDGIYNGDIANTGVYAYVIYEDSKEVKSGNISLLR